MNSGWHFNEITGTMEPDSPFLQREKRDGASLPQIQNGKSVVQRADKRDGNVSINEKIIQFRERSDLTIMQIIDESNREVMGYIAGYGLDIKFNLEELNSMDKVEQFLGGLTKVFRKIILESALDNERK